MWQVILLAVSTHCLGHMSAAAVRPKLQWTDDEAVLIAHFPAVFLSTAHWPITTDQDFSWSHGKWRNAVTNCAAKTRKWPISEKFDLTKTQGPQAIVSQVKRWCANYWWLMAALYLDSQAADVCRCCVFWQSIFKHTVCFRITSSTFSFFSPHLQRKKGPVSRWRGDTMIQHNVPFTRV